MDGGEGLDWESFCEELDLAALVPASLARYRPAVLAALEHFLAHLPADRAVAILEAQAALPADADPGLRLVEIAHHCPVLHKLGQVMARDRRLPQTLRALLQRLETVPCRTDPAEVAAALARELGPLEPLGVRLDGPPIAEASVAQVIPYRWQQAPGAAPVRGVFKLLKPGIEQLLEEELDILQGVGALLDDRCHALGLPEIAYEDTFTQVRALLAREVRLSEEQAHLAQAADLYADAADVLVPALHPFCGPRVTAMARVDGRKVTEVEDLPAAVRERLAAVVVDTLIARPIWSPLSDSLFHADPHAGNLMLSDDGRLAVLDWSLVGSLGKDERVAMTQILLGAFAIDRARVMTAIVTLAGGDIDRAVLAGVVDRALSRIGAGELPGLDWLIRLMDGAVIEARGRFSPDLIIFRKVLQTLAGVVVDIAAGCRADAVLIRSFADRFSSEWPRRWLTPPLSRDFATHISNADLAHFLASAPLGLWRLWLERTMGNGAGDAKR